MDYTFLLEYDYLQVRKLHRLSDCFIKKDLLRYKELFLEGLITPEHKGNRCQRPIVSNIG